MHLYKKKALLFVYGAGGHKAQMDRLAENIIDNLKSEYVIVSISDDARQPWWSDEHYKASEFREKAARLFPVSLFSLFYSLVIFTRLVLRYRLSALVSTGPGLSVPFAILLNAMNKKIVHIETWSRFYSRSLTGFVMHYLSDVFYVQNKELKSIYKRAVYSGRL